MRRLAINFASASRTPGLQLPALPPWQYLLWLAALLALLSGGWQWWQVQAQRNALEQQLQARMQQAFFHTTKPQAHAAAKLPAPERLALNEAVQQLNLPWAAWFAAFEAAAQPKVNLLAITPNAQGSTLSVSAECDSVERMLAYVSALRQTGFFSDVVLRKHRSDEAVAGGSVSFEFVAYPRRQAAQP